MHEQTTLFDLPIHISGDTYEPAKDEARLTGQHHRAFVIMSDGQWRTLKGLRDEIWHRHKILSSESGLSARLRDWRKPQFGSHTVERRRTEPWSGLYEYRLILNK